MYSQRLMKEIADLIIREGGFLDDDGVLTKYGVTEPIARACGYTGSMRDMTKEKATEIYQKIFWTEPKFPDLEVVYPDLAYEVFDFAAMSSPKRAVFHLQRALNAVDHLDLKLDGQCGPKTVSALALSRDRETVLKTLIALRAAFYVELSEKNEKKRKSVYGWLKKRVFRIIRLIL